MAVKAYQVRDKSTYPDEDFLDHGDVMQRWLERWKLGQLKSSSAMPTSVAGKAGDAYPLAEDMNDTWLHVKGAMCMYHAPGMRMCVMCSLRESLCSAVQLLCTLLSLSVRLFTQSVTRLIPHGWSAVSKTSTALKSQAWALAMMMAPRRIVVDEHPWLAMFSLSQLQLMASRRRLLTQL